MGCVGCQGRFTAVGEVAVAVGVASITSDAAGTTRTARGTIGGAAHGAAITAVIDIGVGVGLAPVSCTSVAIAVAGIASNATSAGATGGGAVGAVADRGACSAMCRTGVQIDFAAVGRVVIAVAVASVARDLASSGIAGGRAVGCRALGATSVTIVDVSLQIDFAAIGGVAVAISEAGVTRAHCASSGIAGGRRVGEAALGSTRVTIVDIGL